MSATVSERQQEWVTRVLGVGAPRAAVAGSAPDLQARLLAARDALRLRDPPPRAATEALRAAVLALQAGDVANATAAVEQAEAVLAGAPGGKPAGWAAARQTWQAASEAVDAQIAALTRALRQSGDEELEEVAEYGLNGLTGDHKVRLMAALLEFGDGDAAAFAKLGGGTVALIRAFRTHLETDERIEVCDDNPVGCEVAIRATLVPALVGLEAAIAEGMRA